MQDICVMGLGYIGLPTASVLATHGYEVHGVDVNEDVLANLSKGEIHVDEPGLSILVKAAVKSGKLTVSREAVAAEVFIVAVPTPCTKDRTCEYGPLRAACEQVAGVLARGNLVVLESTVPPGTTEEVVIPILEKSGLKAGPDFSVAHCPERVLPGRIMTEIVENNRIIGGIDEESRRKAKALYETFVEGEIVLTDARTAELAKLAENTYRDINIAFANQLSQTCAALGINVFDVIEATNLHPRVNILSPGPGVGGHCLPLDPWFIVEKAPETSSLIVEARRINDDQPVLLARKVLKALEGVQDPVVAVLGLTYKADVDDVRESPARSFVDALRDSGIEVRLHDPLVKPGKINGLLPLPEALTGADALCILAGHTPFKTLDPDATARAMRGRLVFDYSYILPWNLWAKLFNIITLGNSENNNELLKKSVFSS